MKKAILALAILLTLIFFALPSIQVKAGTTDQSKNLIKNGEFDKTTFVSYGSNLVALYWSTFVIDGNPQYGINGFELGQQIYSPNDAFTAGIYQRVTNAVPGAYYYCYVGTAAKWGAMNSGRLDGHIGRTIGVDPYGGTDPSSPNVIWGSQVWDDAHWNWKDDPNANAPKVWVTAQSTNMTLFLKVMYPVGGNQATVWLDDAAIMPDSTPPTPTPTPLPVLSASAATIGFLAEKFGDPVNSQTLVLAGSNGSSPLSWTIQSADAWLSTSPASGASVPQNVLISVNTTGFVPGNRTSSLTLHNGSNSGQTDFSIGVNVYIGPLNRLHFPLIFRFH